jgi:hypothetical protein
MEDGKGDDNGRGIDGIGEQRWGAEKKQKGDEGWKTQDGRWRRRFALVYLLFESLFRLEEGWHLWPIDLGALGTHGFVLYGR